MSFRSPVVKTIPVSFRAVAFVVFTCICLVGTDVWQSLKARKVQLREAEVATSNLARAAAQQAGDVIKESDTALLGLVERVENDADRKVSIERLHRLMKMRVNELPQLNGLFVYSEDGSWVVTSLPGIPANANNADREYFKFHRTHTDRGPHIGLPVRSRSTGMWIIPVSRRINKADGSFGGVALATVSIDFFKQFYDSLEIGEAGAILLALDSGTMMLRRPFNDSFVGKDMNSSPLYQAYGSDGGTGTVMLRSSQDGVVRIVTYRRVHGYPLFVAAALSKDEMLAGWWRDAMVHSSGVALLVFAVALCGWRLTRQIHLRSIAEARLIATRTELEQANETLERIAMQDGLTGLANRRHFDLTLKSEFGRAARYGGKLSLIMLDVDFFKQYNDTYGHRAGDDCLRAIADAIRNSAPSRPGDLVARYGGEEMAVILPGSDIAGAMAIAEKIRYAVQALRIPHTANAAGVVTISAGVESVAVHQGMEPAELIEAADRSLYAAKACGRNRVSWYREPARSLS
ncbi:diguanylate cyclase [Caballeronia sp. RCC_10]|uniref:sensor domain-containing diguanylate cyclase n=1 Tax=Caballeronia sp. RCC_10 TaxID=3239227 RepID=UPI00352677E1